jgi:hypothetical protein
MTSALGLHKPKSGAALKYHWHGGQRSLLHDFVAYYSSGHDLNAMQSIDNRQKFRNFNLQNKFQKEAVGCRSFERQSSIWYGESVTDVHVTQGSARLIVSNRACIH